jgi:putative ABC transport system substrate-binding protein
VAFAQSKIWRVGYLEVFPRPKDGLPPGYLRKSLDAEGLVEGKDVVYEGRYGDGRYERLPALAAELAAMKVDVIVTVGGAAAAAAKQATSSIPIVVSFPGDVVETGLVPSLARPGGNVTGVNDPAATLSAKRLELLKDVSPNAKAVAVLWNANEKAMSLRFKEIENAARTLRMSVKPFTVQEPDDFNTAIDAMKRERPDALMLLTDALTAVHMQRVVDYATEHRVPAIYEYDFVVHGGGLMSYGSSIPDNLKLAGQYVAKILKGAKPGDLAVEQPNRYFLVVNEKAAVAQGLNLPKALLVRADEVLR